MTSSPVVPPHIHGALHGGPPHHSASVLKRVRLTFESRSAAPEDVCGHKRNNARAKHSGLEQHGGRHAPLAESGGGGLEPWEEVDTQSMPCRHGHLRRQGACGNDAKEHIVPLVELGQNLVAAGPKLLDPGPWAGIHPTLVERGTSFGPTSKSAKAGAFWANVE